MTRLAPKTETLRRAAQPGNNRARGPAPYGHRRRDAFPFRSNDRFAAWPLASFCHSPTALAPNTTP